tara:strand:- start:419 stop:1033 length:615 start_codon:yes stop_codon:yes gene_type:complete
MESLYTQYTKNQIRKIKNFSLCKEENQISDLYTVICKKIPGSIFSKINYNFFEGLVESGIVNIFSIRKQKKIVSIITVVDFENYTLLKKKIFLYLLKNPFKVIINFTFLLKNFFKDSTKLSINKDHLHLLHLVIHKKYFKKITLKEKDNIFNSFFKEILKLYNAKIFFLCYEKENSKANNFYLRNKFKIYDTKSNIIFVKKKIR